MQKKLFPLLFFFLFPVFFTFSYSQIFEMKNLTSMIDDFSPEDKDERIPPAICMIKEIETYSGIQKNIYVALGNKKGIKKDLMGYIYNDPQMKELVGKAQVTEVYSNIIKLKIIETSYKVDIKGIVLIEVDPRFYI